MMVSPDPNLFIIYLFIYLFFHLGQEDRRKLRFSHFVSLTTPLADR